MRVMLIDGWCGTERPPITSVRLVGILGLPLVENVYERAVLRQNLVMSAISSMASRASQSSLARSARIDQYLALRSWDGLTTPLLAG
jgi:hypothetical protein